MYCPATANALNTASALTEAFDAIFRRHSKETSPLILPCHSSRYNYLLRP
jgi:hypothetical protein